MGSNLDGTVAKRILLALCLNSQDDHANHGPFFLDGTVRDCLSSRRCRPLLLLPRWYGLKSQGVRNDKNPSEQTFICACAESHAVLNCQNYA
eukprot:6478219-Amphidinium_carterae.1